MLKRHRPPTHPGVILQEHYLAPRAISLTDFADATGLSRDYLADIVAARAAMTPDGALRIAAVLSTTAQQWLNGQNAYDLWRAEQVLSSGKPVKVGAFAAAPDRSA